MLKNFFGYHVRRLHQALRASLAARLSDMDMTLPQFFALAALAENPGSSNADTARACSVTPQTMNAIVRGMVDAGWVERAQSTEHGRVIELTLTDIGREKLQEAQSAVASIDTEIAEVEDAEALIAAMNRVSDMLESLHVEEPA
ncbi:MAG: MarR family winged helix-turn-helix transcriptional regulator [Chloroflexota bacterium]